MDWDWGGALKGAVSGGATGFMIGGPWGAAAGAAGGGALGGIAGGKQKKADQTRQRGVQAGIEGLQGLGSEQAVRRRADMERAMGFYGPAMQVMEEFYGVPQSSWGQPMPGAAPGQARDRMNFLAAPPTGPRPAAPVASKPIPPPIRPPTAPMKPYSPPRKR